LFVLHAPIISLLIRSPNNPKYCRAHDLRLKHNEHLRVRQPNFHECIVGGHWQAEVLHVLRCVV